MDSQSSNNYQFYNYQYQQHQYPSGYYQNYYYNPCYFENQRQTTTPPPSTNNSYSNSYYSNTSLNGSTGDYSSPNEYYSTYYKYPNYSSYSYQYETDCNQSTPLQNKSEIQNIFNYYENNNVQEKTCKTITSRNILQQLEVEEEDEENKKENNKESKSKRRIRTQFSLEQRRYLLSIFEKTIYPSKEELESISKELKVSIAILQTWFKNTRSKQKKLTHTKNM